MFNDKLKKRIIELEKENSELKNACRVLKWERDILAVDPDGDDGVKVKEKIEIESNYIEMVLSKGESSICLLFDQK